MMTNVNATGALGRHRASRRAGWKPSGWAIAIVLAWLALLALPMAGLYNLDAFEPIAPDVQPKPWMPDYPPII